MHHSDPLTLTLKLVLYESKTEMKSKQTPKGKKKVFALLQKKCGTIFRQQEPMWNRQAKQKFQLTQTFFKTNIIFKKIF